MLKKTVVCMLVLCAVVLAQTSHYTLKPQAFIVKAGHAKTWRLTVTADHGTILGTFRASGGAHNDIRAVVTDSDGCINYLNGNQFTAYYDSGNVTVGKLRVTLGAGEYCITFDNRNSIVSDKAVETLIMMIQGDPEAVER